jgi:hypothetical protein
MKHYTTNENYGEDILKSIAKLKALEQEVSYTQEEIDRFAIGFAEWSDNNYFRMGNTSMWAISIDWENNTKYTTKKLLEKYKKKLLEKYKKQL